MAIIWKFKKFFLRYKCFKLLVFPGEPGYVIEPARAAVGIQLGSLFDKFAWIVAIPVGLIIFYRPLEIEFQKVSSAELGFW